MSYNRKTAPEFVWVCALIIALVGIIFLFSGCSPKQSMPEDFNGTHWSGQMGASEAYAIIADDHIEIIRRKSFGMKPMYPEDACVQMELLGHNFFVFRNAESDEVCVVYKRKGNTYGLIEPEC